MNIGIFDSGTGGTLVAKQLERLVPEHTYLVVDDKQHAPYGERSLDEVALLTDVAIQPLIKKCSMIVIACNTSTAACIDQLRRDYPSIRFVGFEPMIKQAALVSKNRHFTLLATKATASSPRTKSLIERFAPDYLVDIPATSGWATAVDNASQDSIDLSEVNKSIENGSDTIIIGCTHYSALSDRISLLHPHVAILDPTEAVSRQIKRLADDMPHV